MLLQLDPDDDEAEQRARDAIERRTERELRRAFRDMQEALYPTGYLPESPEEELARIRAEFERNQQMYDTVSRALQDSADLGVSVGVEQLSNVGYGFDWTLANESARRWALQHTDTLLRQLGTTSGRVVGQAVGRWVDNGEPLEALIRDLEPVFGRQRSELIASTEVTRAYAEGTYQAYRESGIIRRLVWRTARDERVCPVCGPLEGRVVGLEGSFFDQLPPEQQAALRTRVNARFVRPPAHPRCILPGNLIYAPGGINAMAKSFYIGRCVEVRLASGSKFSVTQNHPVLTDGGWVPAHLLDKSANVISAIDGQGIATAIDPDDDYVPAAIEQIFDTLVEYSMMPTVRMPSATEDLHGEGEFIKGDIDIVYADGLLLGNRIPQVVQKISQDSFAGSDTTTINLSRFRDGFTLFSGDGSASGKFMSSLKHSGLFSVRGNGPAGNHPFRPVSRSNASIAESDTKDIPVDTKLGTEGLFGFSGNVSSDVLLDVGDIDFVATKDNTSGPESFADHIGANPKLTGEFLDRFAGMIAFDEIVDIRYFDFSGHVYDLQSDMYELYICNGVVVKNCRCWIVAEINEVEV